MAITLTKTHAMTFPFKWLSMKMPEERMGEPVEMTAGLTRELGIEPKKEYTLKEAFDHLNDYQSAPDIAKKLRLSDNDICSREKFKLVVGYTCGLAGLYGVISGIVKTLAGDQYPLNMLMSLPADACFKSGGMLMSFGGYLVYRVTTQLNTFNKLRSWANFEPIEVYHIMAKFMK